MVSSGRAHGGIPTVEPLSVLTAIGAEGRQRRRLLQHPLVRYGCMRTRSRSPAPSGPPLSQMAFDTPSRPSPWTAPARRNVSPPSPTSPSVVPAAAATSATAPGRAPACRAT